MILLEKKPNYEPSLVRLYESVHGFKKSYGSFEKYFKDCIVSFLEDGTSYEDALTHACKEFESGGILWNNNHEIELLYMSFQSFRNLAEFKRAFDFRDMEQKTFLVNSRKCFCIAEYFGKDIQELEKDVNTKLDPYHSKRFKKYYNK